MKKTYMKATSFRAAMGVIVALIIGGSVFGFYNAQVWLTDYADQVGRIMPRSDAANSQTQTINRLKADISTYKPAADKADSLIATDQDQISQKLSQYASSTGLAIANSSFRPANATELATFNAPGKKLNYTTINLTAPVAYTNLIRFIKAIEGSVPKMQITDLIINQDPASTKNVLVNPITIEFYTGI